MLKTIVKWLSIAIFVGCTLQAASLTTTWDRPLQYEDGSPLLAETILLYDVHWGTTSCPLNAKPEDCRYQNTEPSTREVGLTFVVPSDGLIYYIAVTARTQSSGMSVYSNEIEIQTINMARPAQPENLLGE